MAAAYLVMRWRRQGAIQIEHASLRHHLQGNPKDISFRPRPESQRLRRNKALGLAQAQTRVSPKENMRITMQLYLTKPRPGTRHKTLIWTLDPRPSTVRNRTMSFLQKWQVNILLTS